MSSKINDIPMLHFPVSNHCHYNTDTAWEPERAQESFLKCCPHLVHNIMGRGPIGKNPQHPGGGAPNLLSPSSDDDEMEDSALESN